MPSRVPVLVAFTVAVVLTSGLGIAPVTSQGSTDGDTTMDRAENSTIQVTASADATAAPDSALIRPTVVATGDTAEAARSQVADDAARMRATLRELGVGDDRVRTTYFDIRAISETPRNETEIVGYRAEQSFEIEVEVSDDDIGNRTGSLVDAVVQNGANQVDGVQFTLSDERRQELRRQALERATNTARGDADHLAAVTDLSITGVHSVSTGDGGVSPVDASLEDSAADSPASVFEPGPVTVSATVSVTYRAE